MSTFAARASARDTYLLTRARTYRNVRGMLDVSLSAARVRAIRVSLGLTQQQLADRAGLARLEIVNVETGRNQMTSHRIRIGLARGLGLSLEQLELQLA